MPKLFIPTKVAIFDYSSGVRVFEHSIYGPSGCGSDRDNLHTVQRSNAALTETNINLLQRAINHSFSELPTRRSKILSQALSGSESAGVDAGQVAAKTKQYGAEYLIRFPTLPLSECLLWILFRSGGIRQLSFTDRVAVRAAVASRAFSEDDEDGDDSQRQRHPPQERSKLRYSPGSGYGALVVCDYALIFCGLELLGAASQRSPCL